LHQTSVTEVEHAVAEQQVDKEPMGFDGLDEQLLDQLIGQSRDGRVKLAGEGGLHRRA
jgi:hypothetical protein